MKKSRIILLCIGAVLAALLLLLIWQLDLPGWQKLDTDKLTNVRQTTLVYGGDGEVIGSLYSSENRVAVSLSEIPDHVQQAFIAAEDLRFYEHNGVDVVRIFGALWQNIKSMSFSQGASTITQQLIKLTHLTSEKTLSRKAQEAVLAMQLERRMSKDEILENYLNIVYFGKGAYGIEAAANAYFGKSASELTISEGALLAGVIKSPSGYAPHINPERALARRNSILDTMEENGFISAHEADAARSSGIELISQEDDVPSTAYAWYLDAALQEAQEVLNASAEEILAGGYRIYTAFDREFQTAAEDLYSEEGNFPSSAADGTPVQSAFVALMPETGEIVALIGGRSYEVKRGLNRATQIKRQPGSALKPVSTYAAAIDAYGYVPSSFSDDTQRTFEGDYAPENSGDSYNGMVTLREALSRSLNVATVSLAEEIGVDNLCRYAQRFGIALDKNDANLSLALGSMTYGVSPAELCAAYGALANGGTRADGHLIRRIETVDGREIFRYTAQNPQAVSAETAYMITDMLQTAADTGSARALNGLSIPIAAKTGTVGMEDDLNRDAWTVAYTPELAVCVWMGFDQTDAEHALPSSAGGGSYPARLAANFFSEISPFLSGADFSMPPGVRVALIDSLSLEQADTVALASANTPDDYVIEELFLANSVPKSVSELWDTPQMVTDLQLESQKGEIPVLSFTIADPNTDYILIRKTQEQTEVVSVLSGQTGELARFADMEADLNETHEYTIIPRHRLLYEEGVLVTGKESFAVSYTPGGVLNRISEFFGSSPTERPAEIQPDENQSIFG